MREDYRRWLVEQGYSNQSVGGWIGCGNGLEKVYGNLDDLFAAGGFAMLIEQLSYSAEDAQRNRPNSSRMQINGILRNSLAYYRRGAVLYARFLAEAGTGPQYPVIASRTSTEEAMLIDESTNLEKQRLSLERDMQVALRRDITRLEPGLRIIDDGAERYVTSGFIDILCKDDKDRVVVVELKAGKSDPRVIGQTLGHMGDLMDVDALTSVRGIIVAHDFDMRTRSAARAVASLTLYTYAVAFTFQPIGLL